MYPEKYVGTQYICGALRDLSLFVQFKKVKKTFGGMLLSVKLQANFTKSNTPP